MTSFRILNQRSRSVGALFAVLASTVASAVVPGIVAAAQVTERSIELSSSSKSALNVTYDIKFHSAQAAGALVVDFCSNSPLLGQSCTAPTGMDASSAASSGGFTAVGADTTASKVTVTGTIASDSDINVTLTGIKNATSAGTVYARLVTFANGTDAHDYASATPGSVVDNGSVALSITDTVSVTAAVLESLSFCVAGGTAKITDNCGDASTHAPVIELGEETAGVKALSSSALSTGDIYTQLSTNAVHGAVVRLKSSATNCGGLLLAGDTTNCYIAPAQSSDFSAGTAKFGVKVTAETDGTNPNGTFQAVSPYNATTYAMKYVDTSTGVTSSYGDPVMDTNSGPVNNKNMKLTFGASITNQTPAGKYSADMSLIATGTF